MDLLVQGFSFPSKWTMSCWKKIENNNYVMTDIAQSQLMFLKIVDLDGFLTILKQNLEIDGTF